MARIPEITELKAAHPVFFNITVISLDKSIPVANTTIDTTIPTYTVEYKMSFLWVALFNVLTATIILNNAIRINCGSNSTMILTKIKFIIFIKREIL